MGEVVYLLLVLAPLLNRLVLWVLEVVSLLCPGFALRANFGRRHQHYCQLVRMVYVVHLNHVFFLILLRSVLVVVAVGVLPFPLLIYQIVLSTFDNHHCEVFQIRRDCKHLLAFYHHTKDLH